MILLCIFFCYLCFVFVMFSCLFIAALWSPVGKGLTPWLSFVIFYCVFVTFPCGILGQVWYLIVSFLIFATFLTFYQRCSHLKHVHNINTLKQELSTAQTYEHTLSISLTSCLTAIFKPCYKYCETVYERNGKNQFWSI